MKIVSRYIILYNRYNYDHRLKYKPLFAKKKNINNYQKLIWMGKYFHFNKFKMMKIWWWEIMLPLNGKYNNVF